MKICDNGHDEVCHNERYCPACELQAEINYLNDMIVDLKKQIEALQKVE